jgi:hypothetical protein
LVPGLGLDDVGLLLFVYILALVHWEGHLPAVEGGLGEEVVLLVQVVSQLGRRGVSLGEGYLVGCLLGIGLEGVLSGVLLEVNLIDASVQSDFVLGHLVQLVPLVP